jgi:hypothetical protein
MGRTLCKTYGLKTRCIRNNLGGHIGNIGNIFGTWWDSIGNLKGTCWEQRKTTLDSALKISRFRGSPDFSADAAWQILKMMLKAELPGWKMHNWWWGGGGRESGIWVDGRMREVERLGRFRILERDWDLGYICHLRSFAMVSCMLLSHGSQAVQTSRFSTAKVPWIHAECGI